MDATTAITWTICVLFLIFLLRYNWKRRFLYYHASKIPGPVSLPILGSSVLIAEGLKVLKKKKPTPQMLFKIFAAQPPVFKLWMGPHLFIVNSNPEDLQILMNTCLEKSVFYNDFNIFLNNTLLSAPVNLWKGRRKLLLPCFHSKIVDSFHDCSVKYAQQFVDVLEKKCDQEIADLLPDIRKCFLDSGTGLDPVFRINLHQLLKIVDRGRELITELTEKPWLLFKPFWNLSSVRSEVQFMVKMMRDIAKEVVTLKKEQMRTGNSQKIEKNEKNIVQQLINSSIRGEMYTEEQIVDESLFMYFAVSQTISCFVSYVFLTLALHPEHQEKINEEILSVTKSQQSHLTIQDTNQLEFLERVVKETTRLFPIAPILERSIDKDIQLGPYTFPAGSSLLIPVDYLHKRPDLWPDPLKFDPDRFLPEEVAKRHQCAYMPFSYGYRNCIGSKYAMMTAKVMVAYVVKNFTMKALNYRSLEDIQRELIFPAKPRNCRLKFDKRTV